MVEFVYTVSTPQGMHARPVAQISACALDCTASIRIGCGDNQADATDIMGLMALNAHKGDELRVQVEGEDEQLAAAHIKDILRQTV